MKIVSSKLRRRTRPRGIFRKVLFVGAILAFLIYGLSFFFAKPTVETITTGAPPPNAVNKQLMRDATFQSGGSSGKKP